MNKLHLLLLPTLLVSFHLSASADPGKHGEYKEKYWDGNCKVERKVKKDGEYKEKRKCKSDKDGYDEAEPRYVEPAAVYVPASPPVLVEPGISVHATVRTR
jgi:hypothetical protein